MPIKNDVSLTGVLAIATTLGLGAITGVSYVVGNSNGTAQARQDVVSLTSVVSDLTKELRSSFSSVSEQLKLNLVYQDRVVALDRRVSSAETRNENQDVRIGALEGRVGVLDTKLEALRPSLLPPPGRRQ